MRWQMFLKKISAGEIGVSDGMPSLGYTVPKNSTEALYGYLNRNPFHVLVSKAFKHNGIAQDTIDSLYLKLESPAVKLMRELLNIPEDMFIDSNDVNEDKIWEFVEKYTTVREAHIVGEKHGRNDGIPKSFDYIASITRSEDGTSRNRISRVRIYEIYHGALYKLRKLIAHSKNVQILIAESLFGIDLNTFTREVYSVAQYLQYVRKGEAYNCTMMPKERPKSAGGYNRSE